MRKIFKNGSHLPRKSFLSKFVADKTKYIDSWRPSLNSSAVTVMVPKCLPSSLKKKKFFDV